MDALCQRVRLVSIVQHAMPPRDPAQPSPTEWSIHVERLRVLLTVNGEKTYIRLSVSGRLVDLMVCDWEEWKARDGRHTLNDATGPRTVAIFSCYCPPSSEVFPPEGGFILVFSSLEPIDGVLTPLTNKFRERERASERDLYFLRGFEPGGFRYHLI